MFLVIILKWSGSRVFFSLISDKSIWVKRTITKKITKNKPDIIGNMVRFEKRAAAEEAIPITKERVVGRK
jgi:hypothetical protein